MKPTSPRTDPRERRPRDADARRAPLERLLARGPGRVLGHPSKGLLERILGEVQGADSSGRSSAGASSHVGLRTLRPSRFAAPLWVGAALAAGVLLGFGLGYLRPTPPPTEPTTFELVERLTTRFVALVESQEATAIDLRMAVDDPLLAEVDAILQDTTLVAQATWNGLPGRLHRLFKDSATEIR